MMLKIKYICLSCFMILVLAALVLAEPPEARKRNPPTHVNVALYEPDYQRLLAAFVRAIELDGIGDRRVEGLMRVRLKTEDARLLMLTISVAEQGTMTEAEKAKFMKAQEEYYRNLNTFRSK